MMELSRISALERSLGRLEAIVMTETDDAKCDVLYKVFGEFESYLADLYKEAYITNDIKEGATKDA